jgi:hypothetical protein
MARLNLSLFKQQLRREPKRDTSIRVVVTNLRTVAASLGLSSTRRFYKDFRNLRLSHRC